jgi:hypothetical protein
MSGVTLDTGALIAFERNDRRVVTLIERAIEMRRSITVPAGAVGQAWRDGQRQARLARLLGARQVAIEPLDDMRARAAGQLCGATGTADIVDASIVLGARSRGDAVMTSDAGDLRRLDPVARLVAV